MPVNMRSLRLETTVRDRHARTIEIVAAASGGMGDDGQMLNSHTTVSPGVYLHRDDVLAIINFYKNKTDTTDAFKLHLIVSDLEARGV